jgi:signal transduction histidine kinase
MRSKRNRLWIGLFVCVALMLASLATGWNVVLVQDYRRFMELTREASGGADGVRGPWGTWLSIAIGSFGFVATLTALAFFFAKVLKETRLNQIQSEFLETVSHELKTPIAAIGLSASLLKAGGLTPQEEARLWQSHASELARLTEEVHTLLEAARLRTKPRTLKAAAIPLDEWITRSLERWKRILGPEATLVFEGDLRGARARVDGRTLDLIADNLVDNARKFSRDRAQPPKPSPPRAIGP